MKIYKVLSKGISVEVGGKFGKVTVVEILGYKGGHRHIKYRCECGTVKTSNIYTIIGNPNFNCGCLNKLAAKERRTSHNKSKTTEYKTWQRMKKRCSNAECKDYPEYGGRGIEVCDGWLNSFENFLEDMGERPEGMTLDRIDVNGNYEPTNCRWATPQTQAYNQRVYKVNTSGKTGVTWNKKSSKWESRISKEGKEIALGFFDNKGDAIKVREEAELKYYGYLKHGSYFDKEASL